MKKLTLSHAGTLALQTIQHQLNAARVAFEELTSEERNAILDFHTEGHSLNHCLRWGAHAADELVKNISAENDGPECDGTWLSIEGLPPSVSIRGYCDDSRWNGWIQPYFEFEAAMFLTEQLPCLSYEESTDSFVSRDLHAAEGDEDSTERFSASTILVDGNPLKTYAIGYGLWCWYERD